MSLFTQRIAGGMPSVLMTFVAAFVLGAIVGAMLSPDGAHEDHPAETVSETPGEGSAEAGFVRDMIIHHAQAVEMAEIVRDRTQSEEIRNLAANIALAQQAEIGQMRGWLEVWGLSATGSEPAMSWMGHPTEGQMPGMASPEEIDALQTAPPEEMDVRFLQLMIPHHEAALPMAEAILERTDRPEVERLATAIVASQQAEIKLMQNFLQRRGVSVEDSPVPNEALPAEEEPHHESQPHSHDESHSAHEAPAVSQETAASIAHGATLGAVVFLVGLVAFVALVWLPTSRIVGAGQDAVGLFVPWIWALLGLLLVAGAVELSLYAVRASGEPFGLGLLGQALSDTRVGHVWLARIGSGLLTAVVATLAVRLRRPAYWWGAAGIGSALLETLTLTSHAAAEGLLPSLADWLHVVAASVWMGGLLGFPLVLLGPPRTMPAKQRTELRWRAVRRFSKVATLAVMTLIVTGVYATLLHVPSVEGLLGTAYGRALMVKLGLAVLLLAAGGVNLVLEGRGPFKRVVRLELILAILIFVATGFLTTLPPASVASP
ncbi:MAG: DUF305 domain-containing protein [Actinomycetota bacterium]|nr:DUF305 domain-containing protein [Actinomycetota bacterium]